MPIRRKGRRVPQSQADQDTAVALESGTVQTNVATTEDVKPEKKKLTRAEKALLRLEKKAQDFRKSGEPFNALVKRLDLWLTSHKKEIMELFRCIDSTKEGYVTYDEFKAGLFDIGAPCNKIEMHAICKLLDTGDTETIEYGRIDSIATFARRQQTVCEEVIHPALSLAKRTLVHCPCCQMATWNGTSSDYTGIPRYVSVIFRLITFDHFDKHGGHFKKLVHSHITVHGLHEVIRTATDIQTMQLAIFTDKSRDPNNILSLDLTLEDCGCKGGPEESPEELILYYDYGIDFTDCPILLCDHYFGKKYDQKAKSRNVRQKSVHF